MLIGIITFFFSVIGLAFMTAKVGYFNALFTMPDNIAAMLLLVGLSLTVTGLLFLLTIHENNERKKRKVFSKSLNQKNFFGIKMFAGIGFYSSIIFLLSAFYDKTDILTLFRTPGESCMIGCIIPIYCGIQFLRRKESGRLIYLYFSFLLYSIALLHVSDRMFDPLTSVIGLFSFQSSLTIRVRSLVLGSLFYLSVINPIIAFYYLTRSNVKEMFSY